MHLKKSFGILPGSQSGELTSFSAEFGAVPSEYWTARMKRLKLNSDASMPFEVLQGKPGDDACERALQFYLTYGDKGWAVECVF